MFDTCECAYCKSHGEVPWLWYLEASQKFWLEIPKNASLAIKQKGKTSKTRIKDLSKLSAPPIVVWRDPVDRFKSLTKHFFVEGGGRFETGREIFKRKGDDIKLFSVPERVDWLIEHPDAVTKDDEAHHFWPQTSFMAIGRIHRYEIIPINSVRDRMGFGHRNVSPTGDVDLSAESLDWIREFYRADYEFIDDRRSQ